MMELRELLSIIMGNSGSNRDPKSDQGLIIRSDAF